MDLEECSKSGFEEVVEEKESGTLEKMAPLGGIKVEINGDIGPEEHIKNHSPVDTGGAGDVREGKGSVSPAEAMVSAPMDTKVNGAGVRMENTAGLPLRSIVSPPIAAPEVVASKPTPTKGYGLKKWRRIRRDLNKDGATGADSAQVLKRRLSLTETQKARDESKQKSDEGSMASVESRNARGAPLAVAGGTLDPELGLLVAAAGFSIGMDSENSEDRSSKSSTAASAPRLRHEAVGFGRERGRVKNSGGRGSGNVLQQRGQQGRGGGLDISKKFRGDQVRIEKENSHSSVESDLRSSDAAFMQRGSVVNNAKQSDKSINDDGYHSDEAQPSEEVRSPYHKENGGIEDLSKVDLDAELLTEEKVEKSKSHWRHPNLDPFVESLILLEAAQQALESEIENIGEIGKEPGVDDFDDNNEEAEGSSSPSPAADSGQLNRKMEHLQYKLEEALAIVKARESKVLELEAILNTTELAGKEIGNTDLPLLQEKCKEMEVDLDRLLEKKMQAEIEYLIMTRTTQSWKLQAEDHIALLEDQKSLAGDQTQIMLNWRDTENKVIMLKGKMEELEAYCKELVGTGEVLRLQNKVFKSSLCCFIQLVMLSIAFGLFLMQLFAPSHGVVPT
ncbi:WPP domain-interacting protein 2 isoform X2 [Elaeis guineensis]|uniref:WPP domain-interacting protein 2 isoform X3 n=1 Tax=Elaeis guineensis var. tenera TaxID=51953 RepID=A0A6I9RLF0_ELAGV|nr:WPP domain-interacting protein 2 isoform X3 [Elaeis guineensis]